MAGGVALAPIPTALGSLGVARAAEPKDLLVREGPAHVV